MEIEKEINILKGDVETLKRIIEHILIVNEGIQELDGDCIDIYNQSASILKRRTSYARHAILTAREKHRIEMQIDELQRKLRELE